MDVVVVNVNVVVNEYNTVTKLCHQCMNNLLIDNNYDVTVTDYYED